MKPVLYFICIVLILLSSCKKEDDTPHFNESNLAPLSIEFDNIVGDRNLQLSSTIYTNSSGEPFTISLLQYYISNIKVTTTDGQEYTVPQDSSYFLISATNEVAEVKVPAGDYSKLSFILGVDSLRCTMPIEKRTGVLDPSSSHDGAGMYWSWNSGYIFFKMEGNSTVITTDGDPTGNQRFRYHIGGFGGYNAPTINNIKTVSIDLSSAGIARVRQGRESNIHLFADIMKVFDGETPISIAGHSSVMFSDFSVNVANNYKDMFRHDHTEN